MNCCLKVLVLEDEESLADLYTYTLVEMGCEVYKAVDAIEAKAHLQNEPRIHLAFLDYFIPDHEQEYSSDPDSLLSLLQSYSDLHYFFATGNIDLDQEKIDQFKAEGVIHKPFTMEELHEVMKSWLKKNRKRVCTTTNSDCSVITGPSF